MLQTWYASSDLHKQIYMVSHGCYDVFWVSALQSMELYQKQKKCNPLNHYRLNNQRAFLLFLSSGRAESSMVWSRRWWALVGTVTAACRLFSLFSVLAEAPLSLSLECKWETVTSSSRANWKNKTHSRTVAHHKFCILPSFSLELARFADDVLLFFSPLSGGSLLISFQLKGSFEKQAINTVIRPILVNVYNSSKMPQMNECWRYSVTFGFVDKPENLAYCSACMRIIKKPLVSFVPFHFSKYSSCIFYLSFASWII